MRLHLPLRVDLTRGGAQPYGLYDATRECRATSDRADVLDAIARAMNATLDAVKEG